MLREIHEQPLAIAHTLAVYLREGALNMDILAPAAEIFRAHKDVVIAASGSSRHAGLAAEIMLEDAANLSVDVEYASEYICRSTNTKRDPAVIVISQSGETADTLAALREAVRRGHPTIAVTNVSTSSMAREAAVLLPTNAGIELAIPATKSFTTQLVVLRILSLLAAHARETLTDAEIATEIAGLERIPAQLAAQLDLWEPLTRTLADKYHDARTLMYLGRAVHYAIAREGALKLKESSYIHAEGYPSGELKHGPNALVSDSVPLVFIATADSTDAESVLRYGKTVTLLEDLQRQRARTIVLANTGDTKLSAIATDIIPIAPAGEYALPIYEVVPMQMFAYFMALKNGVDVDAPRNLVKSVMVE